MTLEFKTLLENLDFTQHVTEFTHHLGNTLDLVMSKGLCAANVIDFTFPHHLCEKIAERNLGRTGLERHC